jgi:hypothetical protein
MPLCLTARGDEVTRSRLLVRYQRDRVLDEGSKPVAHGPL